MATVQFSFKFAYFNSLTVLKMNLKQTALDCSKKTFVYILVNVPHRTRLTNQIHEFYVSIFIQTIKSSCVMARGIPPAMCAVGGGGRKAGGEGGGGGEGVPLT